MLFFVSKLCRDRLMRWDAPMKFQRLTVVILSTITLLLSLNEEANAWGCVAVSMDSESDSTTWSDLTYGYSFQFQDQISAQNQALQECVTRTPKDRICKIVFCESGM